MKIILELTKNNVISGKIHIANEDYSNIELKDNLVIANINEEDVNNIILYKTKYEDGQLVQLEDYCQEYYDKQNLEEQKWGIQNQLTELDNWFNEYDMQVKQYERDIRLGIVGTYHIGEEEYTIEELDNLARQKASQITEIRQQIKNLE